MHFRLAKIIFPCEKQISAGSEEDRDFLGFQEAKKSFKLNLKG